MCFFNRICQTCLTFDDWSKPCPLPPLTVCLLVPADSPSPWDAHPTASPSLSEVALPLDSLSMPSPSSHLTTSSDPAHQAPLEVQRDPAGPTMPESKAERSQSPCKAEPLNPDKTSQGRRAAGPSNGSSRAKQKEGGRSTRRSSGPKGQPATEGGLGGRGEIGRAHV